MGEDPGHRGYSKSYKPVNEANVNISPNDLYVSTNWLMFVNKTPGLTQIAWN